MALLLSQYSTEHFQYGPDHTGKTIRCSFVTGMFRTSLDRPVQDDGRLRLEQSRCLFPSRVRDLGLFREAYIAPPWWISVQKEALSALLGFKSERLWQHGICAHDKHNDTWLL